jgi:hypothetical protein
LLESRENRATIRQIAEQFLQKDESQTEYYMQITKAMPGRIITFDDFEITEAMLPYEIIPQDNFGHGIYVDIVVSDITGFYRLMCLSDGSSGGGHGRGITNGEFTADWGCDGLEIQKDADCPCSLTINGSVRYTNEFMSHHDEIAENSP